MRKKVGIGIVTSVVVITTLYMLRWPLALWQAVGLFSAPKNYQVVVDIVPEESRQSVATLIPQRISTDIFAVPNAHASIVMDAASGEVLYGANIHEERPIASLTKVMTALLLMESGKSLQGTIRAHERAINQDGTTIGCGNSNNCQHQRLVDGEEVRIEDLLHAMLMNSANDAAFLIAEYVAGSPEQFVELMNKRAAELGMNDTHFCTPNGLEPDTGAEHCHSSAYDVALYVQAALKYDHIWQTMQMQSVTFRSVDGRYEHVANNTNQLLGQYAKMKGAKTGFTPAAGYSLLSVGQEGDREVIAVLLNDPQRWEDVRTMIDWAFGAFHWI